MIRTFLGPLTLWPIPTPLFPLSISGEKGLQAFQSICVATLPCFLRGMLTRKEQVDGILTTNIFVTSFRIPGWYAIETSSLGFEYIFFLVAGDNSLQMWPRTSGASLDSLLSSVDVESFISRYSETLASQVLALVQKSLPSPPS